MTTTAELVSTVREGIGRCSVHGIPDCSPLLNGCSRLNKPHAALDTLAERVETLERDRDEWKLRYEHLFGATEEEIYVRERVEREHRLAAEVRIKELERVLREIADFGHEMDDYDLPPKQARKIARAALE